MPDPIKGKKQPVKKFTDLKKAKEELSEREKNIRSVKQRYPSWRIKGISWNRKENSNTYSLVKKGDPSNTLSVTPGPVYDKSGKCIVRCNQKKSK